MGLGMFLTRDKVFTNAAEVREPTLILQGEADEEAFPGGARRLFESLAAEDKKLEMFPGAGHALYKAVISFASAEDDAEKREQVFSAIKDWLKAR
jgi:dipeptidyl aminopeptidase/acylaminoacyl peptidase